MHRRPKTILGSIAAGTLAATAAVFGINPASAAAAPTFDIVPLRTGYGPVTLTGTADPGDTVHLYEWAYVWGYNWTQEQLAEEPANDYKTGGFVTTTANSSGRWSISRDMDSGHVFMVGTDDGYSQIRKGPVRVKADLNVTASGSTVDFRVNADPAQPGLPVRIQRYSSSGGWTTLVSGLTVEVTIEGQKYAIYEGSVADQPSGVSYYRAFLEGNDADWADKSTYVVANYSENQQAGSGASNGVPPGNPTPSPVYDTGVTTPPTTPTTKPPTSPTTKPPTTPPTTTPTKPPTTPAGPAVGAVQFTRIQYNAPGVDKKTNKSYNGEYFRLTNKTKSTINLKGWTVRDAAGNLYRFTANYNLAAGKNVLVRTGKGTNTSTVRYWGKAKHVWNNGGDTAYVRTGADKTIDTCRWTKPGNGYTNC
ncbi:lamin tail domain-containing protein [Actinoplanes sp. NPDC049802]|uniref:lamin tail domain-containing protein n=1 Tax=Actinoplanes sp. NPDC049802 TaxID=3154742 RepID=UPI0033D7BD7E